MTLSEAQALRSATYAALLRVLAGGVEGYSINGRSLTKTSAEQLQKRLNEYDMIILRLQGGGCSVAQFRNPE